MPLSDKDRERRYFGPPSGFRTRVFKDEMKQMDQRLRDRIPASIFFLDGCTRVIARMSHTQDRIGQSYQRWIDSMRTGAYYERSSQSQISKPEIIRIDGHQ